MKRNPTKEGRIVKRKGKEKYTLVYLGEKYNSREFRDKYCPELPLNGFLYYVGRRYSPAEIIVRYNSKHTPIHEPDVDYTYTELDRQTRVLPTRKVREAKAKRDREKYDNPIKRIIVV